MKKCKYCKSEIDTDAKICPNCHKKQGIPIWLIVTIVIVIFGVIGTLGSNNNDNSVTNNEKQNSVETSKDNKAQQDEVIEYIKVSKDDLDEALENNAAAAKDTYNKKYVEITGKLGTIDSDLKYFSLVSTTKTFDINGIQCTIKSKEQKEIVKTLAKDQEITVKGKITDVGEVLGYFLDITEIIEN